MEITPARTDKRRLFARRFSRRVTTCFGWGLNIALSLVWYLFDCDDECNYRNR